MEKRWRGGVSAREMKKGCIAAAAFQRRPWRAGSRQRNYFQLDRSENALVAALLVFRGNGDDVPTNVDALRASSLIRKNVHRDARLAM